MCLNLGGQESIFVFWWTKPEMMRSYKSGYNINLPYFKSTQTGVNVSVCILCWFFFKDSNFKHPRKQLARLRIIFLKSSFSWRKSQRLSFIKEVSTNGGLFCSRNTGKESTQPLWSGVQPLKVSSIHSFQIVYYLIRS